MIEQSVIEQKITQLEIERDRFIAANADGINKYLSTVNGLNRAIVELKAVLPKAEKTE